MFPEAFHWDATKETRAWRRRFAARFPVPANRSQAAADNATLHCLKAVARIGNSEGAAVVAAMKGMPVNDFWLKGVRIPFDHLKRIATIPADQACRPLAEDGCAMVGAVAGR